MRMQKNWQKRQKKDIMQAFRSYDECDKNCEYWFQFHEVIED